MAHEKYDELRTKGRIERAWLGIQPLDVPEEVREQVGLELGEGVFVGTCEPTAPAERGGHSSGDVILKWNDHVATDPTLLSRAIAATEIGSTAKLRARARSNGKTGRQRATSEFDVKVEVERHHGQQAAACAIDESASTALAV